LLIFLSYQHLGGSYKDNGAKVFSTIAGDTTRGNGNKLKLGRVRLSFRKNFFIRKVKERYPERWQYLHPWRVSRLGQTKSW